MKQIPRGPEGLYCPLWRDRMSKRCHTCPMWTQIRGRNPMTGEDTDQWMCAVSSLPMLLVENAQQGRSATAAMESFRNEVVRRSEASRRHDSMTYRPQMMIEGTDG